MDQIDVKTAVKRAKDYVAELFASEKIGNLGLEELDYDDAKRAWVVTIGFVRVWDRHPPDRVGCLAAGLVQQSPFDGQPRTYKTVTVADDGTVRGIKNRDVVDVT
jgi:hypothetical protein